MRVRLALVVGLTLLAPVGARAAVGSIAGTVTDAEGAPIHSICVDARATQASTPVDQQLGRRGSTQTSADGTYRIEGLLPGPYIVHFHECPRPGAGPLGPGGPPPARHESDQYAPLWWTNATTEEAATPVRVTIGPATGVDAVLHPQPGIAGVVTDDAGVPVAGITVAAVSLDGGDWRPTATGPDGRYKLVMPSVEHSAWKITFVSPVADPAWGEFAQEWYPDQASFEDALIVEHVGGWIVNGIDASLARTGTIKGTVTNTRGEGLETCVEIFEPSGEVLVEGSSDGAFAIGGLSTGAYKVRFRDCSLFGYEDQWFGGGATFDDAAWIDVTWGEVTDGIDVVLRDGGAISGRVTDTQGRGLAGWYVRAIDLDGRYEWTELTDDDGRYRIGTLVPSTAIVSFTPPNGGGVAEWYEDTREQANATPVPILAERETSGIDAII